MKKNQFTLIIESLSKLTHNQKRLLHHHVVEDLKRGDTDNLINECKGDDVICPHCGHDEIGKWLWLLAYSVLNAETRHAGKPSMR